MNMTAARVMALLVTSTSLAMAAVAGWYRGSAMLDRSLLIAISIAICAGSHLIPSISKSRISWMLWAFCLIGALYSHITFFSYTSLHSNEDRSQHSIQVMMSEQQIMAAREALAAITARPLPTVALELAITKNWRRRNALVAELSEAKRAVTLRDEIVRLLGAERVTELSSATDPVTAGIARVTGTTEQSISIFSALGFSVLLELLGAFLWYQSFQGQQEKSKLVSNSPTENELIIIGLEREIAAGQVKPTVQAIRAFLRCSQTRAMEVRRQLLTKGY